MNGAYDLIVIGSGTAAQVASVRLRAAGWTVAVIDHRPFGGTCALRGCDPKKMLISGAEAVDGVRRMRGRGVEGDVRIDWPELIAFKCSFTDPIPAKQEYRYAENGIDAFHGLARIIARDKVKVEGEVLAGRHILIATGARPAPLGIPGEEHVVTSDRFLELERLPERIALIGGGYIAAEFSHIAARAGARVTILQRRPRMLPAFDPPLVCWLMEKFGELGVDVRAQTGVEGVAFTIPPIAAVGLSEMAARERDPKVRVKAEKVPDWYTARRLAESVYGYKTLVEEGSGRILGAHLVGPHADEVINLFALAIRHGLTVDNLKTTMFAYPTGASDIGYML